MMFPHKYYSTNDDVEVASHPVEEIYGGDDVFYIAPEREERADEKTNKIVRHTPERCYCCDLLTTDIVERKDEPAVCRSCLRVHTEEE